MKKPLFYFITVLTSVVILNSCTSDNNSTTAPLTGAFLVAQISPNATPLNVSINGNSFDTGMVFGNYTPYVTANPGSYIYTVKTSGNSNTLLTSTVDIAAKNDYSFFIIDSFSKIKAVFINDVFQAPASDSVYIRFLNFCPNLNEPISLVDSNAVYSANRTFSDQSLNPQFIAFNEELSGTYNFSLKTVSGTVIAKNSLVLTGEHVYTLFAKGIYGRTDSTALSIGLLENYPQR